VTNTVPNMEGYLGHAYGPVVEEIEKEEGAGMGKAVVLCIGWESKERHMAFRETESFKENIHFLREGVTGAELVSSSRGVW
jgi:heme-degrading monooxygenase HmoA